MCFCYIFLLAIFLLHNLLTSFTQQFITRLSAVRPNVTYAMQSTRFYCAQSNSEVKTENVETEQEDDKLYKRLEIELRGHDKMVIKSYVKFATTAAQHLDIDVGDM